MMGTIHWICCTDVKQDRLETRSSPMPLDFALGVSPATISVTAGAPPNPPAPVTVVPVHGFSSQVTFTPTSVPTGLSLSFAPNPATGSTSAYVTAGSTLSGIFTLKFSANGGGVNRIGTITVNVLPF